MPILLEIMNLLDNLIRVLKVKLFSLWCQTRRSLLFHPKRYSVDYNVYIPCLANSASIKIAFTSLKLVGSCDVIWVGVRRYYPASRVSS